VTPPSPAAPGKGSAVSLSCQHGPGPVLTVTRARQVARQARQYGHYAHPADVRQVRVTCPECREQVTAWREPRQASRGPVWEPPARALDRAMIAHLTGGWCTP
jgi:hypothetical protein